MNKEKQIELQIKNFLNGFTIAEAKKNIVSILGEMEDLNKSLKTFIRLAELNDIDTDASTHDIEDNIDYLKNKLK